MLLQLSSMMSVLWAWVTTTPTAGLPHFPLGESVSCDDTRLNYHTDGFSPDRVLIGDATFSFQRSTPIISTNDRKDTTFVTSPCLVIKYVHRLSSAHIVKTSPFVLSANAILR